MLEIYGTLFHTDSSTFAILTAYHIAKTNRSLYDLKELISLQVENGFDMVRILQSDHIQYRTKRVQPNNANLVSLYKSAAFFQFREITM